MALRRTVLEGGTVGPSALNPLFCSTKTIEGHKYEHEDSVQIAVTLVRGWNQGQGRVKKSGSSWLVFPLPLYIHPGKTHTHTHTHSVTVYVCMFNTVLCLICEHTVFTQKTHSVISIQSNVPYFPAYSKFIYNHWRDTDLIRLYL